MGDPYKLRFEEDRAIRTAAKRLVEEDLAFLRGDNARRNVGTRRVDRTKNGAGKLAEDASQFACENSSAVASGVVLTAAALALVLFRRPLLEMVGEMFDFESAPEPEGQDLHSDTKQEI